jgi:hypothetical protein
MTNSAIPTDSAAAGGRGGDLGEDAALAAVDPEVADLRAEATPDAEASDADASEVDAPDADAPDADAPDADVPDTDAPDMDAPDADAPDAEAPVLAARPAPIQAKPAPTKRKPPAPVADDEDDDDDEDTAPPAVAADAGDPWWSRWLPTLMAAAGVAIGWSFIGWHYRFRVSPAMVFLCLGWLAVVSAVLFLWRTAFTATDEADEDLEWWRPSGATDELVREKKSLLKAIKEIEFDRELGKMNNDDADQILRMYRARAIEVIKAIDVAEAGAVGAAQTVRDEIDREVRARREIGAGGAKAKAKEKAKEKAKASAKKSAGGAA